MKNLSLVLNVVLLAAVGYLYYHAFSGSKSKVVAKADDPKAPAVAGPTGKVAYINMDSLEINYSYFKSLKAEFENKQQAGNNSLEAQQKKFQGRMQQLQQKAQTMTPQEQEAASAEIQQMQEQLQKAKMELDNELYKSSTQLKENIYKKLEGFLNFQATLALHVEAQERHHTGEDGGEPLGWLPAGLRSEIQAGDAIHHKEQAVGWANNRKPRWLIARAEHEVFRDHLHDQH